MHKNHVRNKCITQYWLSFVHGHQSFGDFGKRRSFVRFFGPALFHQRQGVRMHVFGLLLGKFRSVERCTSIFDFLHDHYVVQWKQLLKGVGLRCVRYCYYKGKKVVHNSNNERTVRSWSWSLGSQFAGVVTVLNPAVGWQHSARPVTTSSARDRAPFGQ